MPAKSGLSLDARPQAVALRLRRRDLGDEQRWIQDVGDGIADVGEADHLRHAVDRRHPRRHRPDLLQRRRREDVGGEHPDDVDLVVAEPFDDLGVQRLRRVAARQQRADRAVDAEMRGTGAEHHRHRRHHHEHEPRKRTMARYAASMAREHSLVVWRLSRSRAVATSAAMDLTDVLYEKRDGTAWITINRPERRNAFRGQTVRDLIACVRDAWHDSRRRRRGAHRRRRQGLLQRRRPEGRLCRPRRGRDAAYGACGTSRSRLSPW